MKIKSKAIITLSSILLFANTLFAEGLTLKSNDMQGQMSMNQVFNGFGCTGKNISPQLNWTNAPKGTKSFAITMYDPDAPTGSGWWHWVVFDMPSNTKEISTNASALNTLPKGSIQGKSDYGTNAFGGACPPEGSTPHTYITTIYALDTKSLKLTKDTSSAIVGYMLNAHTIEKSSIVTYYKR
jgi:Raf kinase inhibitor-like YbhB/YbcL family protein